MNESKTYITLLTRAANLYDLARKGNELAIAVENIMTSVCSEIEDFKTLTVDDEAAIYSYVEFVADGMGYTPSDILGDE
tara:strand:- start:7480 stop:7716 length:237 start_codon:yes stop_codon:yes gene_type:complete